MYVKTKRFNGYEIRSRVTYSLFGGKDIPITTYMLIEKYEVDVIEDPGYGVPTKYTERREKVVGSSKDRDMIQHQMDTLVLNSKGEKACK